MLEANVAGHFGHVPLAGPVERRRLGMFVGHQALVATVSVFSAREAAAERSGS
jgi:hypothetical protein